ncbi:MAG TPA: VOC family protein, partial [Methylomirabilota bacterium]|nr:VOC family protein [Methylomirabilota bacterium]
QMSPAISFVVNCENQAELDNVFDKLAAGGQISQCGWLTDKFGVTWQITPAQIGQWMQDPVKAERVMQAILPMKKIDIETVRRAYEAA